MIKVYALSTCPQCKKLKILLDEKGINYTSVDVDKVNGEEKEQTLKKIDQLVNDRSFPITVVNETVIQGYNPNRIEEELKHGS